MILATRLFPPEPSAAAFRVAALADGLVRGGADVTVLTTKPPKSAAATPDPTGMRVRRWPVLRDRSESIRGYVQYASFDIPLFFRMLLHPADVIVAEAPPTTGLVALVVARLRRLPFVYYPGDVWTDGLIAMGASRPIVATMRWIESRVVRGASRILAVSPEVAERFHALGAPADHIDEIGNGIDTTIFRTDLDAPAVPRPYFVYTGTMSEWQRPEVFVEALAEAGDGVDLRFFGQGTSAVAVRVLAERTVPGRVHHGGLVSAAESARWIRGAVASLVSIVPGVGYDFARPTKTYAAAACGTPVVYAGGATGAALVRDGNLGEAVEFSPGAIAAAMRRMLVAVADGSTERLRDARATWARDHVSLAAVGDRAASAVLASRRAS